eukprot:gene5194-6475_t
MQSPRRWLPPRRRGWHADPATLSAPLLTFARAGIEGPAVSACRAFCVQNADRLFAYGCARRALGTAGRRVQCAMPSISLRTIREEHASLAAVLHSLRLMLDQGPGDEPAAFFDVMRAMLFYIDEFPERQHHPKESQWLFPRVTER